MEKKDGVGRVEAGAGNSGVEVLIDEVVGRFIRRVKSDPVALEVIRDISVVGDVVRKLEDCVFMINALATRDTLSEDEKAWVTDTLLEVIEKLRGAMQELERNLDFISERIVREAVDEYLAESREGAGGTGDSEGGAGGGQDRG